MTSRHWKTLAASLLFLAFYWRGLSMWFYQDDFGWLHLLPVNSFPELLSALFLPKAHGNMRPWSENGFFMLLATLFGIDPLPFRIVVFATVIADLFLIAAIVRRLTGSEWAAFWTQILWMANSCVAVAFCWTSIYNQTQYLFFILLAFLLFLRHIETGERSYLVAQWAVFLLGFGALEVNVVYPAMAALYALLFARSHLCKALPMFAASALYMAIHFTLAPVDKSGAYALHFGLDLPSTLWTYFRMTLGPERLSHLRPMPVWFVPLCTGLLTAGALGAAVVLRRFGIFALGLFVILLAPLLPLRDHVMDYYLTGPALGLALLGGAALVSRFRWTAAIAAALYLCISLPASWAVMSWHLARSEAVRNLVLGVVEIHSAQPTRVILLSGVSTDLFFAGIADLPFELYGIRQVYLAPGADAQIADGGRLAPRYVLPPHKAHEVLDAGRASVYDASGPVLKNITTQWRARTRDGRCLP